MAKSILLAVFVLGQAVVLATAGAATPWRSSD
jgi:hypothetical protein